jgi:hypothetical protein
MLTANAMDFAPHLPAAKRAGCISAALCSLVQRRKAAAGSWKINSINNLPGARPGLIFITPVVRQHVVPVTTRWASSIA